VLKEEVGTETATLRLFDYAMNVQRFFRSAQSAKKNSAHMNRSGVVARE